MLTVVASLKSPGVTTTALALGYVRQATVVEADPCGGDVAGWMGWPDLGLSGLAADARRQVRAELLGEHARATPYGLSVVAARSNPDGAAGSVAALVEVLPKLAVEADLVVDAGRLGDLTAKLLPPADQVVLLVRPQVADLARLATRLDTLRSACGQRLSIAVFGLGGYGQQEIADTLGCPVATTIPYDLSTAAALQGLAGRLPPAGAASKRWRLRRFRLLEAVSRL